MRAKAHAQEPSDLSSTAPLPDTAQIIAEVVGREATLALAARCLYRTLYIPKRELEFSHWIPQTIGPSLTRKLQAVFGGEQLFLANCHFIYVEERNRAIRQAFRAGDIPVVLSARYGLTVRQIQNILKAPPIGSSEGAAMRPHKRSHSSA